MEHQKIINMSNNTTNEPTKFRTKKWVEINDDSRGTYNTNSQSDCNWTRTRCGFESSCSHLNFRFRACFEQGGP